MLVKDIWHKIKQIPVIGILYEKYIGSKRLENINQKKSEILQRYGVETIKVVETALSNYHEDFVYFADFGTLLGIVRNGNFIQWDDDLDYGFILDDKFSWDDFEKHMAQYDLRKIREFSLLGKITEQTYKRDGLTIDFFAKTYENNEFVAYLFFKKQAYWYKSKNDFHVQKRTHTPAKGTKQIPFLGTYVTIPANEEEYLERIYSSNWRIPNPHFAVDTTDKNIEELDVLGKGIVNG